MTAVARPAEHEPASEANAEPAGAPAPAAAPQPPAAPVRKHKPVDEATLARERRLVRRLKTGDERAFQEMVRTYQDRIFGLMYRMIGNRQEAEDLAQEVFITVYRAIGNYRGEGRFYTWLYRIASNTCKNRIKYLKGRNFHRAADIDESPEAHVPGAAGGPTSSLQSQVPGPEAAVEGNRLQSIVQRELANLDEDHRLLIVLRDIQGLSYADIVRITGLQEGTVKSRLHRARVALKARVAPHLK